MIRTYWGEICEIIAADLKAGCCDIIFQDKKIGHVMISDLLLDEEDIGYVKNKAWEKPDCTNCSLNCQYRRK